MDENVVGFLLGVLLALFGFLTLLASVGLVVFTIRKVQKRGSGLKIILYAIESATPFSIVCALAWVASNTSYDPIALWVGVCLVGVITVFILFHKTPQGSPIVMRLCNAIEMELGGKAADGQKIK